ncbi:ribulose-phosphate 3-epimerase, partial [Lacticaseibacillus rhamnosus MTCC 5462]
HSKMIFDIHMMLAHPEDHLEATLATGAEMLSVHYESTPHVHWVLQQIKQAGRKAGIVLNPGTPETVLPYLLDEIDYVLVMSINPGRPGQSFLPLALDKIRRVKQMIGERPIQIEVDGGVNDVHAAEAKAAGADLLVVGGFLFGKDPHAQYAKLNAAIK